MESEFRQEYEVQVPPLGVERMVLYILLIFFCVVGAIGNTLVLIVYRVKRDYSVSTFFIKVLAVTDLMVCLFVIPSTLYCEYYYFIIWNDFVCKVYHFMITSNIPFSALVLVAIAVERYICICHPFASGLNLPRAKVLTFILLVVSGVFGITTSLSFGIFMPDSRSNLSTTAGYTSQDLQDNLTTRLVQSNSSFDLGLLYSGNVTDSSTPTTASLSYNHTSWTNRTFTNHKGRIAQGNNVAINPDPLFRHPGECSLDFSILSFDSLLLYQPIYSGIFLIEFFIICVLYLLIYRSVVQHRSRKKRRQSNGVAGEAVELNERVGLEASGLCDMTSAPTDTTDSSQQHNVRWRRRYSFLRDRNRVANIKTAAILFVVTLVFMLSYFPSLIMAHGWIPYNVVAFYMYFLNNVANPVIYAFMNRNFRTNLAEALTWYKRHKSNCCCPERGM